MSNIPDRHAQQSPTCSAEAETEPTPAATILFLSLSESSDGQRSSKEVLHEVIFALQISHAQMCRTIEEIPDQASRDKLRAQSAQIIGLLDIAWRNAGEL